MGKEVAKRNEESVRSMRRCIFEVDWPFPLSSCRPRVWGKPK